MLWLTSPCTPLLLSHGPPDMIIVRGLNSGVLVWESPHSVDYRVFGSWHHKWSGDQENFS
jgi:hypothetical protein